MAASRSTLNKRVWHSIYALLFLCWIIPASHSAENGADSAQPAPITLHDIIMQGIFNSKEIDLAQNKRLQRAYETEEAEAALRPTIDINADTGYAYNNPFAVDTDEDVDGGDYNQPNSYGFTVRQKLFDGFAASSEIKRREEITKSAVWEEKKEMQDTMFNVIQLYLTITRLQKQKTDTKGYVKIMKTLFETVNAQQKGGGANLGDVKYIESRLAAAESQLVKLDSQISDNMAQLKQITGDLPYFKGIFSTELIIPMQSEQALDIARQHNYELQKLKASEDVIKYAYRGNESNLYPTFDLEGEARKSFDIGGETGPIENASMRVRMAFKLYDGGATIARRKKITMQKNEIDIQKELAEREIKKNVVTAYSRIESIEQDVLLLEKELQASKKLFFVYLSEIQYDHGDVVQLTELQERIHAALLKLTDYKYEYSLINFKVLTDMGKLYDIICQDAECEA